MDKLIEQLKAQLAFRQECAERLVTITDIADAEERSALNDAEEAEFAALAAWVEESRAIETKLEGKINVFRSAQTPSNVTRGDGPTIIIKDEAGDPFDVRNISIMDGSAALNGRAMTAIEKMPEVEDSVREAATKLLTEAHDPKASGSVAKRFLATGSDAYRSGFTKMVGNAGHLLNEQEREALARAASLTDAAGGFAVPFTLDPTIILTNAGAANPVRQISRVVSITTDTWNGITSAGITAGYGAEASEVGDDAPTLAQPSITPARGDAFVPFSFEIGQDWASIQSDMLMLFADGRDRADSVAFITGSGTNAPTGIRTELLAGASEVDTTTAEVLVIGDFVKTYAALPPRHRNANTAAIAEYSTLNELRRLLVASGDRSSFAEATGGVPASLYGFPIYEASSMDAFSAVNPAATAVSNLLTVGDFSRNYVIVDRVGMNVELVPHLFATANNRPSGQRGFLAWWRTGSESVNDDAFRALTLTTAA